MRWYQKMSDNIKRGIRNWLQVQPASAYSIQIQEYGDFELEAIRNRIWFRGDSNELEQMYQQKPELADRWKFWASKCTPGMEMRKIHTGLPALMVRVLSTIVLADMNEFEFENDVQKELWDLIAKDNDFMTKLEEVLQDVLVVGDGAFKIAVDTSLSDYPLLCWYPGEYVEYVYRNDHLKEVIFKTAYNVSGKQYVLNERYGLGYIRNELYQGEKQVDISLLGEDAPKDYNFDKKTMLAVPLRVFKSTKYKGRGGSVYASKHDSFDSFDEAWSQWMDALRAGRAKTYIPDSLTPKNPMTGESLRPNAFDNRFFAADDDMAENTENKIVTDQPVIPHESYQATYSTALDLCLQGIISPSTLGIDVKKLDNSEAQREKEKATLYTRNAIVEALQKDIPKLVAAAINAQKLLLNQAPEEVKVNVPFGEYANPSFESQVETVGKGKTQGIMSIEACVDELYGDTKDKQWKQQEVARLKAEQGIATVEEAAVNAEYLTMGGMQNEGRDREQSTSDVTSKL